MAVQRKKEKGERFMNLIKLDPHTVWDELTPTTVWINLLIGSGLKSVKHSYTPLQ